MTIDRYPYIDGEFIDSPEDRPPQLAPVIPLPGALPIQPPAEWEHLGRAWRWSKPVPGFGPEVQPAAAGARRDLSVVALVGTSRTSRTSSAERTPRTDIRRTSTRLKALPSDDQWRETMRAADAALGYFADPDIYGLLAVARQGGKGFPASTRGGSGGGGISDPTGVAATSGDTDPDEALRRHLLVADAAAALLISSRSAVSRLAYRRGDEEARERKLAALGLAAEARDGSIVALNAGQGECEACGQWCSGAENDRLRSGFCFTHYQRWYRSGRPDRFGFVRDVQVLIEAEQEAEAERHALRVDKRGKAA